MVDVATVRRLGRTLVSCQLIIFATFNAVRGASACNPAKTSPVEPARPHLLPLIVAYPLQCG